MVPTFDWTGLTAQKGLFWYYPNLDACIFKHLEKDYHIWTEIDNHRIMLGGLFDSNVKYVATSIASSIAKVINTNTTHRQSLCHETELRNFVSI